MLVNKLIYNISNLNYEQSHHLSSSQHYLSIIRTLPLQINCILSIVDSPCNVGVQRNQRGSLRSGLRPAYKLSLLSQTFKSPSIRYLPFLCARVWSLFAKYQPFVTFLLFVRYCVRIFGIYAAFDKHLMMLMMF